MVLRLKCSNWIICVKLITLHSSFLPIEIKMIMSNTALQDEYQLLWNSRNSMNNNYYTLRMRGCQPPRAVKNSFISMSNFKEKHAEIATHILPVQPLFLGCGSEADSSEPRVPSSSVFRERFSWSVLHCIILCGNKAGGVQGPWIRSPRESVCFPRFHVCWNPTPREALKERMVCLLSI